MIEQRAIVADDNGHAVAVWVPVNKQPIKVGDGLVTVADVLAALRKDERLLTNLLQKFRAELHIRMDTKHPSFSPGHDSMRVAIRYALDQFEREQGSAT